MSRNEREAYAQLELRADQARRCGCWQHDDERRNRHDAVAGILISCGIGCVIWAIALLVIFL